MNIEDHGNGGDTCDLEKNGMTPDQDSGSEFPDLIWRNTTADVIVREFGYVYNGNGLEWLEHPIWE